MSTFNPPVEANSADAAAAIASSNATQAQAASGSSSSSPPSFGFSKFATPSRTLVTPAETSPSPSKPLFSFAFEQQPKNTGSGTPFSGLATKSAASGVQGRSTTDKASLAQFTKSSTANLTPHRAFSFEDGNVSFAVGSTVFTVHRFFFVRDSPVFRDMFALGPKPDSTTEGSKVDPILLPGVQHVDFERFLKVLYPTTFDIPNLSTAEEWHSVLLIADRFNFSDESGIRNLAIRNIEKSGATTMNKLVWGKQFGVKSLLREGYREICDRAYPLKAFELAVLDFVTVELIMSKREELVKLGRRFGGKRDRASSGFNFGTPQDDGISDDELDKHFDGLLKNAQ